MADKANLMKQCLELTKQVLDIQGEAYINIRMGDSFQFTFNNQENVVKKKSPSQAVRDKLRHQVFKEKKVKEESEENISVENTIENGINSTEFSSKENVDEEINVWKVKAFCEVDDLEKLEKHILEEKDSNVFQQTFRVEGIRKTYRAIKDLENVRKVQRKDENCVEMNFLIGDQYSIDFIENISNWPRYVKKIEREICTTKKQYG